MKTEKIEILGIAVFLHEYEENELQLIQEGKTKGTPLTGSYSFIKHQPHNPAGDYHLHVYKKGNQVFSINKSGRGHDGYSGTRIPNKVFKALKNKFGDWNWPKDQIIESYKKESTGMSRGNLRKVDVFHYSIDNKSMDGFIGYFHLFGNDPFLTGGNGGWKERTVAIIETEEGEIRKVPINRFKFIDI